MRARNTVSHVRGYCSDGGKDQAEKGTKAKKKARRGCREGGGNGRDFEKKKNAAVLGSRGTCVLRHKKKIKGV